MLEQIMDAIIEELNVGLCRRDIANHWACRCTVPGPGMRQAGEILVRRYLENGAASAELIPYPADDRTEFLGGHKNGLEWRPQDASLTVVEPAEAAHTICRYDEPLSLVCYSSATPAAGVVAEMTVRSGALRADEVLDGEFSGKLLFTDQPPASVAAAARKGGAVGVISDCVCPPWLATHPPVREPEDAPDLVMWTIFPGVHQQTPLFGFNLSGRQGRRLRKLIETSEYPVKLRAFVDAETVEGSSDFVHAVLPGTDLAEEEVWVLAHLSEPGARDNASGCCLGAELLRVLRRLIDQGILPPLRRTIRFMNATEVSGFLPYIDAHQDRLPKVVAGLCLDSVGQDFTICGGELVLFRSPEHNASFIDGLLELLITAAAAQPVERFSTENYAILPWHTEPFWGNDAFISDGFFDIPTPQLTTWPDRFYHSSQDTPDQMSDNTLGRVGAITGAYLYLLATAGAEEARWFARLAAQDFKQRLCVAVRDGLTQLESAADKQAAGAELVCLLRHLALQGRDAVTQAARFAPSEESGQPGGTYQPPNEAVGAHSNAPGRAPGSPQNLQNHLQALAEEITALGESEAAAVAAAVGTELAPSPLQMPAASGAEVVYRRLRWPEPRRDTLSEQTVARLGELGENGEDFNRIWRWVNGRRSVGEIWQRLQHGGELSLAVIQEYLELMAAAGAVELAK